MCIHQKLEVQVHDEKRLENVCSEVGRAESGEILWRCIKIGEQEDWSCQAQSVVVYQQRDLEYYSIDGQGWASVPDRQDFRD